MKTHTTPLQHNVLKSVIAFGVLMALWLFANPMNAQNIDRTVTGVVSSLDGPLRGATITLKGTTIGTFSDETGAFTFPKKLRQNDILVVSFLGLITREVTIDRVTAYIEPFLEEDPIIIEGALRIDTKAATGSNRK